MNAVVKHKVVFVATTPFAVNAFLRTHLLAFSRIYDVTLCVNTHAYPLAEEIVQAVRVWHIDIARKISPVQDWRALLQLLHCLKEIKPTVVHSMTPKAGLLAMMAGWRMRVPNRLHTFTGQVWSNRVGLTKSLLKLVDRLIVGCATQLFADSQSQCRFLEVEGVVKQGAVSVLGKGSVAGVDLKRFHVDGAAREALRTKLQIKDDVVVFLFVGRLSCDKGISNLLESFGFVNAKHENTELWMVGPDEEGLKSVLEPMAKEMEINVRWFEPTFFPEQYIAAADILVLPSFREGFGSVIIEAAACGIPAIAFEIDGVIDSVVSKKTGVLVEPGNWGAYADAMALMLEDSKLRLEMGANAYNRVVKYFSSHAITFAWLAYYERLLSKC